MKEKKSIAAIAVEEVAILGVMHRNNDEMNTIQVTTSPQFISARHAE